MEARRKWYNIFQVLKGKNWQHKIYIQQKYPLRTKGLPLNNKKDKHLN